MDIVHSQLDKTLNNSYFWGGGGGTHEIPFHPMIFLLVLGSRQGARDAGDHVGDDAELC